MYFVGSIVERWYELLPGRRRRRARYGARVAVRAGVEIVPVRVLPRLEVAVVPHLAPERLPFTPR